MIEEVEARVTIAELQEFINTNNTLITEERIVINVAVSIDIVGNRPDDRE